MSLAECVCWCLRPGMPVAFLRGGNQACPMLFISSSSSQCEVGWRQQAEAKTPPFSVSFPLTRFFPCLYLYRSRPLSLPWIWPEPAFHVSAQSCHLLALRPIWNHVNGFQVLSCASWTEARLVRCLGWQWRWCVAGSLNHHLLQMWHPVAMAPRPHGECWL